MSTKVCVLGSTGTGKSALCNLLSGGELYPVSAGISSCTYQTTAKQVKWRNAENIFTLIDTPGLGDTNGNDSRNISAMVDRLKEEAYINAFLLVFNSQNPRLDEHIRAMLEIFDRIFSKSYFSNVLLVFTRWEYDGQSERKRQISGVSKESRRSEFNSYLRQEFGINHYLEAVFLDNYPDWEDSTEQMNMQQELNKLKNLIFSMTAFHCQDVQAAKGQIDALRQAAENERREREAAQAEAERQRQAAEAERQRIAAERRQQEAERQRREEENRRRQEELERQRQEQARIAREQQEAKQRELDELARQARKKKKKKFLGIL